MSFSLVRSNVSWKKRAPRARWRRRLSLAFALVFLVSGCVTPTPRRQGNICEVFEQQPDWYDYARASEKRWGTPVHVQMAFVWKESSFQSHARPPMRWFLFIPLGRPSTALGYAQPLNQTWGDYKAERGSWLSSRTNMKDALDFIGWYNAKTRRELGISLNDAHRLYLAYHEGRGGYRRGTWKKKPKLRRAAQRVAENRPALQGPARAVRVEVSVRLLVSDLALLPLRFSECFLVVFVKPLRLSSVF